MTLLLPAICLTTQLKYRPIRKEPPHILTPNPDSPEIQVARFLSCSFRRDMYHKPKGS